MDFGEYAAGYCFPPGSRSLEANAVQSAHEESHVIGIDLSPIQPAWWAAYSIR